MTQTNDAFMHHLESLDPGGRATLRRSLAFPPGSWPRAFPYVEPWVVGRRPWDRKVAYLVAGLKATSRANTSAWNMGEAAYRLRIATDSGSIETRFIALLDADPDQLPHRLRQMVTLMSAHDIAPDWAALRRDLERWTHPDRFVQQRWARAFYAADARNESRSTSTDTMPGSTGKETKGHGDASLE